MKKKTKKPAAKKQETVTEAPQLQHIISPVRVEILSTLARSKSIVAVSFDEQDNALLHYDAANKGYLLLAAEILKQHVLAKPQ
jgi:hypothetical protein